MWGNDTSSPRPVVLSGRSPDLPKKTKTLDRTHPLALLASNSRNNVGTIRNLRINSSTIPSSGFLAEVQEGSLHIGVLDGHDDLREGIRESKLLEEP